MGFQYALVQPFSLPEALLHGSLNPIRYREAALHLSNYAVLLGKYRSSRIHHFPFSGIFGNE